MYDQPRIVAAIEAAARTDSTLSPEEVHDAAFHMTDWLDDLRDWAAFCESPESFTADQTYELLLQVLVHVPNHLNAATKILTGLPNDDVFGIGATLGTGQPHG